MAFLVFFQVFFMFLSVAEKWQAVYTVLEAFGNASSCINGNASCFSHVVSLDFDQTGQLSSASIQVHRLMFTKNNFHRARNILDRHLGYGQKNR